MSDSNIAQDQLKSFVRRIESVEDEIAALNSDKSEIYKEARSNGFDAKILRKVVAKRKLDPSERDEQDTVFDLYWDAVHGTKSDLAHAHVENIEEFPVEKTERTVVASLRADPAMSIVDPTNLKTKSNLQNMQSAQTIPTAVEAQRSTPVDDVGSSGEANPDIANAMSNEAPMEVDGDSVEDATAPLSESVDILPGGNSAEVTDGPPQPPAVPVQVADKSVEAQASAAPAPKYAEPGVIVWETTPPEGVERGAISMAFGTMGQDLTVIADDLEKANAAPIVKKGKVILDGWARYMAVRNMTELDGSPVAYPVVQYAGSDVLTDIIKLNVEGRILTEDQKRKIAANLASQEPSRKDDIYRAFELWMEPV